MIKEYMFVADCHGMTTLTDEWNSAQFHGANVYCRSNEHRRCIWGMISLEDYIATELIEMMNMGNGNLCLDLIKQTKYSFTTSNVSKFGRWMKLIPNSILDPFYIEADDENTLDH